jgi:hypothetical protein
LPKTEGVFNAQKKLFWTGVEKYNYIDLVVPGGNIFKRYRIPFMFSRNMQGAIFNELDHLKNKT